MLESTFIHCPGVGPATERRLWAAGVADWAAFLAAAPPPCLRGAARGFAPDIVRESIERLAARDHAWFASAVPAREHWRAYPAFADRVAFLDIETTGGSEYDAVTVIGVHDGRQLHQFVRNENLRDFPDFIREKALLITFFGTGFDLPFLRRELRMDFPQLHIDLCHVLRRLGLSGGLKRIEAALGVARSPETCGLDGWDAVRLWWRWHNADDGLARDTLLGYNAEDVTNMRALIEWAYPRMVAAAHGEDEAGQSSTPDAAPR